MRAYCNDTTLQDRLDDASKYRRERTKNPRIVRVDANALNSSCARGRLRGLVYKGMRSELLKFVFPVGYPFQAQTGNLESLAKLERKLPTTLGQSKQTHGGRR